jgi:hypothetical protein
MTVSTTPALWLTTAFTVGFFAIGLPYWQIPYAKVALPDTLYGFGLLVVGLSAFAARILAQARLTAVIFVVGGAVPVAVLARVIVETSTDPTSHNLWPLEFIIAAIVGLASSSAGACIGSLARFIFKQSQR